MNKLIKELQELADKANDKFAETANSYYDAATDAYENAAKYAEICINEVIKKLEDNLRHCHIGYCKDYDNYEQGKYDAYCDAIRIMKGSGADEDNTDR